jgi:hypothetical protein
VTEPAEPLVAPEPAPRTREEIARAIANLSDDEKAFVLYKLERALRKRKLQLTGYLVAMVVWLAGTLLVLAYIGTHDGFLGWLFLVPFGFVGAVLYGFGRWAERVSPTPPRRQP